MRKKQIRWKLKQFVAGVLVATLTVSSMPMHYSRQVQVYAAETESVESGVEMSLVLDAMGGTLSDNTKTVISGEVYGTLPTPTKEGYTFDGWYDKQTEGTLVTEKDTVSGHVKELYAYWTPISVRVDLYGNGADEFEDKSITVTYGRTFAELPVLEKKDYVFDGWYTAYNGGERVYGVSLVNHTSPLALYAQWKGKECQVSFDGNGVKADLEPVTVTYGKTYGELPVLKRKGYVFTGWYLSGTDVIEITGESIVTQKENHVLYAGWEKEGYKITLETNVNRSKDTKVVYTDETYGTLPTPSYKGHTFLGWYSSLDENGEKVTAETPLLFQEAHTLYGKWKANKYEVLLVSSMNGIPNSKMTVTYGETYGTLDELEQENYTFLGWYTEPIGGEKVETGEKVEIVSNQTLYAQWQGNEYTVTFDAVGGTTITESKEVYYGSTYGTLPNPRKNGYDFGGWVDSPYEEKATQVTKDDVVRLKGDQTLYAVWNVKEIDITLNANGGSMVCDKETVSTYTYSKEYGSRYGQLPKPEREGYTFDGWYTEKTSGTKITSASEVTATKAETLYARWSGNTYTVTFYGGGDENVPGKKNVVFGKSYGDMPKPERTYQTFQGWYTDPTEGTKVTASTVVKTVGNHTLYPRFVGQVSYLYFDSNGGSQSVSSMKIHYGEKFGTLPSSSRTGYEFLGWYTEKVGGERIEDNAIVYYTENVNVYAHWKAKEIKLTFDANGGTVDIDSMTVVYGNTFGSLPIARREGYTFEGWFASSSASSEIFSYNTVTFVNDRTYTAHWTANKYTVFLDLNGGTSTTNSLEVTYGSTYGTLPAPKRTGYTFAGWYSKKQNGDRRTASSVVDVAANHTLYAKWKSEIYIVRFSAGLGKVTPTYVAVDIGRSFSEFPIAVRDGCKFLGWYSSSSGGQKITSVSEADTLYAHWEGKTYEVTFDTNGGKLPSTSNKSKNVVFGQKYGIMPTPTRDGYNFFGWYTGKDSGSKKTETTQVKALENHTLYAKWRGVSVKINYDANGGNKITSTKNVIFGNEYGKLSTPTRKGYEFLGWYTHPDGGRLLSAESIVDIETAHTLYAHWQVLTPTIEFKGNGGKVDDGNTRATTLEKEYTYGKKYSDLPYAYREGYEFLGWYTSTSGGTQITENTICDITTSDILYAQWRGKDIQVAFDTNGGECDVKSITVYYSGKYGTLPVPVKEGYTFKGWYTKKFGGELIDEDSIVEEDASRTLYAGWKINTYTITIDGNGGLSSIVNAEGNKTAVKQKAHKVSYQGTYAGTLKSFPLFYRTGYDFIGFYTESGELVTLGTEFAKNSAETIYANWRAQRITVTLNANGGDPIGKTITVLYGGTYGELPVLTRVGYDFDGWTKTKGSAVRIGETTTVSTKTAHEIYAKWVPKQYQVSFDANGGSVTTTSVTVSFDTKYDALPTAKRDGYSFLGWYTEKEGGRKITSSSIVDVPENIKLYAHWQTGAYKVTFNGNSGTAGIASKEVYAGEMYGELPNAIRKGYDFTGWYTARTGGDRVDEVDPVSLTRNQTLYAQWSVKTPNVLFYANGGNLDSPIKTVQYGQVYGELPTPELEHYTFGGWYTALSGGKQVLSSTTVSMEETHVLYAKWIPATVMVSFEPVEGSVPIEEKTVSYESNYGELPYPENGTNKFAGWYTEKDGGKLVTDETVVRNVKDHTLYAHWEKARSIVRFYGNGGTVEVEEKLGTVGAPYGKLPNAERAGYIFLGWYTEKDGGKKVEETDCIPTGDSIVLYAHWQSENITITFDAMGGTIGEDTKEVVFGEEYGELPTPEKQGCRFVAWYLDTEWQNRVEKDTIIDITMDHTLYAYYVEDTIQVDKSKEALHFGASGFNPASGNISFSCTDMVISLGGLRYTIGRTYNSKNESTSVLGKGWTFGFEGSCRLEEERAVVYLPDGSMHVFRKENDGYIGETSHESFTVDADGYGVLTKEDRLSYGFNPNGTLSYVEDRNGNRAKVSYKDGVISELVDSVGRRYELEVNEQGYLTKITDPVGNVISYHYDAQNNLEEVTNLLGGVTKYVYDEQGDLEKIINPNGTVIQDFSYTEESVITESTDAYGSKKTYVYYPEENRTVVSDTEGLEWVYWYNSDMYITDIQNPDGSMTRTEYEECEDGFSYGDVKSTVDEYGNKTEYERDANGNVVKLTYSDGATVAKQYDEWNNCIVEQNEIGIYTYYLYDENGINLLKVVQGADVAVISEDSEESAPAMNESAVAEYCYYSEEEAQTLFGCPLSGLLKSSTNGEGETVTYTYDSYGNIKTITDAAGNMTQYSYDAMGNKLSEITPEGNKFEYEYLPNGFLAREYYPDGGVVVFEYDTIGNLTKSVSQELYEPERDLDGKYAGENGVRYQYNANGQLLSVTDVLGCTTSYSYDCNGNLVTETKEDAEVITYAYDERNRLVKQWYQETAGAKKVLQKEVAYETLPGGEYQVLTSLYTTDTDKIVHVNVKDNRGRQKEEYILNGGEKTAHKRYTYYPNGDIMTVTENGYTTSYRYDDQGNVVEETVPFQQNGGTVSYVRKMMEYDRAGRMVKQTVSEPLAAESSEVYETVFRYENGQLISETDPSGLITYYTYDGEGNVIRTITGEGTVEDGTAIITEATYDFRNNPLTETLYVGAMDLAEEAALSQELVAVVTSYQYDKEGRIVKKSLPDTELYYTYDAAGNVVKEEQKVCGADGTSQEMATVLTTYNKKGQVTSVTDALGATTKYSYDNRGNLIRVEDALGGITLYEYNYYNQKIAEVLPENYEEDKPISAMVRTQYAYDGAGRPVTQTEYRRGDEKPEGVVTKTYTYDAAGNVVKTSDAYRQGTKYTYHPNGQVATELSAIGQQNGNGDTVSYTYDIYGNVKEIHSNRRDMFYTYDKNGRLLSVSDNLGEIESNVYDELGRRTASIDGNGNVTSYTYNGFGKVASETLPGDASIASLTTQYLYDRSGRIVKAYDTLGNQEQYRYDSMGNMTEESVLDKDSEEFVTTSYRYDLNGNKTEQTDALGNVIQFVYDELGRVVQENLYDKNSNTGAKTINYRYDQNGNQIAVVDYLGNTTTNVYDEWNRLTTQYDALGNPVSQNVYDENGRQISATDALGNTTYYAYDANGNLCSITDPVGAVTVREYDADDNMIAETDALGNRTGYVYDARNRLVGVQSPMGEYNAYEYDRAGNLTMQTDGAGNRICYTFNARNLETSRQDIGAGDASLAEKPKEIYTYTADGKLSSKTDRNGILTTYGYDGLGRLAYEKAGEDEKQYTYDVLGNPLSMTNGTNVTSYSYDIEGRIKAKTESGIGTVTYTYDIPVGKGEVKEVMTMPDGVVQETVYDAAGRISSVSDNRNKSVHYVYNANGSRQAVVYADGTREDYTYDGASRVSTLSHTDRNGELLDYYEYTYDSVGNLTEEKNRNGSTCYTYDTNRRLKSVTEPEGRTTTYTYDMAGNRATKEVSYGEEAPVVTTYMYNSSNHLITECTGNEVIKYMYDGNGNLVLEERTVSEEIPEQEDVLNGEVVTVSDTTDMEPESDTKTEYVTESVIRYTYDAFNRMTGYETDGVNARYSYNAEDYRTGKNVTDSNGIKNIEYFYDESRVIMEADGAGTITSHNLYGTNLIGRSVQGEDYHYLYNAHGDVVMLLDAATGTVAGTYRYDAFGNVILETGTPENSITYAGYQYDEETGLYYLNARYYDSATARFLTEDTFRGSYQDPLSLNRYTYCHNNPIAYTDPSGHFIIGVLIGAGVGALFGAGAELINQKFIQKKDKIDWKAVGYEAGVGAVSGALGGVAGGVAKSAGKAVVKTTVKSVAKKAVTTGAMEAVEGFASDVGRQVIVDGKSLSEVDYGQAAKTGLVSGVTGTAGYAIGAVGDIAKSTTKNARGTLTEIATKNLDDAADDSIVKGISKSGSKSVNPKDVNFMQSSIKNQTGEYTVLGNAEALKSGVLKATDLPEIRIWKDVDGKLWTLDHRRLAAYRIAELDRVPFKWASEEEIANQMWKMTTKTNGTSVNLKLGNGQNMIVK